MARRISIQIASDDCTGMNTLEFMIGFIYDFKAQHRILFVHYNKLVSKRDSFANTGTHTPIGSIWLSHFRSTMGLLM